MKGLTLLCSFIAPNQKENRYPATVMEIGDTFKQGINGHNHAGMQPTITIFCNNVCIIVHLLSTYYEYNIYLGFSHFFRSCIVISLLLHLFQVTRQHSSAPACELKFWMGRLEVTSNLLT